MQNKYLRSGSVATGQVAECATGQSVLSDTGQRRTVDDTTRWQVLTSSVTGARQSLPTPPPSPEITKQV